MKSVKTHTFGWHSVRNGYCDYLVLLENNRKASNIFVVRHLAVSVRAETHICPLKMLPMLQEKAC